MSNESNGPVSGLSVKPGDGLLLCGLVVSVDTVERKWKDEPAYNQLKATVTNGKRTFVFTADDKKGQQLPVIVPFTRIRVDVEYADADKGNVSVRGRIVNE